MGNPIVMEALLDADFAVVPVFEAADAKSGVADPQCAIGSCVEAANGQGFFGFWCSVGKGVTGKAKQNSFGSAYPNVAGGILGHRADDAAVFRQLESPQFAGAQSLDGVGTFFANPEIPGLAYEKSVKSFSTNLFWVAPFDEFSVTPAVKAMRAGANPDGAICASGDATGVIRPVFICGQGAPFS